MRRGKCKRRTRRTRRRRRRRKKNQEQEQEVEGKRKEVKENKKGCQEGKIRKDGLKEYD